MAPIYRLLRLTLITAGILLSAPAYSNAPECGTFKAVPFNEFINNMYGAPMPFTVTLPAHYELATLKGGGAMTSYWMPPDVMAKVQESGDLPVRTGFITVKPSANVGYDEKRDVFMGAEAIEAQSKAAGFTAKSDRHKSKGHALLFIDMVENKSSKVVYSAYISANADTIAFNITYRPPNDDRTVGDCVWNQLRQGLGAPGIRQ